MFTEVNVQFNIPETEGTTDGAVVFCVTATVEIGEVQPDALVTAKL